MATELSVSMIPSFTEPAMFDVLINDILPLLAAALLGGLVGLERELRGRAAGLRTHVMVSMGSAIFVIAGATPFKDIPPDVTRVIQGVAAGIGFIGAGTIIKLTERLEVKGLTTASSIWVSSGVGVAAGLQLYALAICGTVVSVLVLSLLQALERLFGTAMKDDVGPSGPTDQV